MLAQFYNENLKNKGLEIIFVSSDKTDHEFKEYLGEMPWYALPFADRDRKNKLSAKYKVQGIPTFVILEPSGELITTEGRRAVMTDKEGNEFPWRPKPVTDLLSKGTYVDKTGAKKTFAELSKDCDAVGLYFSASWCGYVLVFPVRMELTIMKPLSQVHTYS
jgi:nucleoredoxin